MIRLWSLVEVGPVVHALTKNAHKIVLEYTMDQEHVVDNLIVDADDAVHTISYLVAQDLSDDFVLRWFDTGLEHRMRMLFMSPHTAENAALRAR